MARVWTRWLVPMMVVAAGCEPGGPIGALDDEIATAAAPAMIVYVAPEHADVARAFVATLPVHRVVARAFDDPAAHVGDADVPEIALLADETCAECYRIERSGAGAIVHGDAPAGIQYGLAALLEAMGYRFYHPQDTLAPDALALPPEGDAVYGALHQPEMDVRGLHLHTLHPIEAYYAFLQPSPAHLVEAKRIVDWIAKNRGNYVQWWLLDDIQRSDDALEAARAHTRAIVDYAHMRGVRTGVGVQLFAGSNLQKAFDLTGGGERAEAEIAERLGLLDGFGFDALQISFGEFSGEAPDRFVSLLNVATAEAIDRFDGVEVTASVHVGSSEDLRIDYMGETDLLYYFLVRYADPRITPWIHTVMYYTLFDDAGGAYLHDDFQEHREYLYDRLRAGEPVAYFPETAYWVAFDSPIPMYVPLYIRSRWRDQARIREDVAAMGMTPLEQHVTFTSGWEWGYWQQDYLTLRSHYEWPERYEDAVAEMLAPMGDAGATTAEQIVALAELQHTHLIENRLAAYLAGRDTTMDAGFEMGIVGAPDRVEPDELVAMSAAERAAFAADVMAPLAALTDGTEAILARLEPVVGEDRWLTEVRDGVAIDVQRARFVHARYGALLTAADGGDPTAELEAAAAALEAARPIVERRHAALHDPEPTRITARRQPTTTLYQYGYLREANLLCFWERELAQVRNELLDAGERVPGCVL